MYSRKVQDATGAEHVEWVVESQGMVIGTGQTADAAAYAAYLSLMQFAELAQRHQLPNRFVNRILADAAAIKPRDST